MHEQTGIRYLVAPVLEKVALLRQQCCCLQAAHLLFRILSLQLPLLQLLLCLLLQLPHQARHALPGWQKPMLLKIQCSAEPLQVHHTPAALAAAALAAAAAAAAAATAMQMAASVEALLQHSQRCCACPMQAELVAAQHAAS
jgi:hypothetical protein